MNSMEWTIAIVLTAVLPLTLAACDSDASLDHATNNQSDSLPRVAAGIGDTHMDITLLGFDGCPMTPLMKQRLEEAITRLEPSLKLIQIDQHSLDASDLRRGYPAPTVVVNGSDLYGMQPPASPSMGCRIYDGPDGVPSVDDLVVRLHNVFTLDASSEGGAG